MRIIHTRPLQQDRQTRYYTIQYRIDILCVYTGRFRNRNVDNYITTISSLLSLFFVKRNSDYSKRTLFLIEIQFELIKSV